MVLFTAQHKRILKTIFVKENIFFTKKRNPHQYYVKNPLKLHRHRCTILKANLYYAVIELIIVIQNSIDNNRVDIYLTS